MSFTGVSPKQVLKNALAEEIKKNKSASGWGGTGVTINRFTYAADSTDRAAVQIIGKKFGCHTCKTKIDADFDQPWIGDHILPTNLTMRARKALLNKFDPPSSASPLALDVTRETVLFPQCDTCAKEQSALVRKLNGSSKLADTVKALTDAQKKLLLGGKEAVLYGTCILSSGDKVTAAEGMKIQNLGETEGCHSCPKTRDKMIPAKVYIADHTFPQEFCTPYMEKVFDDLGLDYPTSFELRPQCPKCSGNQGGNVRYLASMAQEYAKQIGIPVYK